MSDALLHMDIERLIVFVIFFLVLYIFLKFLLFLKKTAKDKFIRFLSSALLLCTVIVLSGEIVVRFSYFLYYKEVDFLVYPFRAFTRNYININWTPQYYFKNDGAIIENVPVVYREYQGLNYFKATENRLGFRYHPVYNQRDVNIVTLGGSSTWGHNSDGQTYPDYLKDFLYDKKFNVFNLGKRAHCTGQFINTLKKFQLNNNKLKIDIAILYCGHNDSGSHHAIFPAYHNLGEVSFYDAENFSLIKYSLLIRNLSLLLSSTRSEEILNKQLLRKTFFDPKKFQKGQQVFLSSIISIIEYLRSINKNMMVLLVPEYTNYHVSFLDFKKSMNPEDYIKPSEIELYKVINYDFYLKYKSLEKVSKQLSDNVHFVDIDFFSPYFPQELLMDGVHLKRRGNKILAKKIANYIRLLRTGSE